MVSTRSQRIPLSALSALTLHANRRTASRRLPPVPQLSCQGSLCRKYTPDVVQCVAVGADGVGGLEWKCEADLPGGMRLGEVQVSCEGWEGPDDPYILRGSCGLTYSLVKASPAFENSGYDSYKAYLPSRSSQLFNSAFNLVFWALTLYLLATFLWKLLCPLFRRSSRQPPTRGPSRPWPWPWGGGWGGGGGGGGRGGNDGPRGPPPPYTPKPNTSFSEGDGASWRPGFWSGAAAGWLANAFLGSGARARRWYEGGATTDAYGRPLRGMFGQQPGFGTGGLWGGFGGQRQPQQQPSFGRTGWGWGGPGAPGRGGGFGLRDDDDNDRGVGTSASGGMRRSTGFGGTNVR